jgi:hypothetical protein
LALLALAACAPARLPPGGEANFELVVDEGGVGPAEDYPVYAEVFVDKRPAGRTGAGRRSAPKRWKGNLPEGNHLMRFEIHDERADGASRWRDDLQPRERFIRVDRGSRTKVLLHFLDRGRRYEISIERVPDP